jgi:minor extracellular serine protease Vpr
MTRRSLVALALPAMAASALAASGLAAAGSGQDAPGRFSLRTAESDLPEGFQPALVRQQQVGRYFVVMKAPAVADRVRAAGGSLARAAQRSAADAAREAQAAAVAQATSAGGDVVFRYDTLVNGFSARLSPEAAQALAERPDVANVEPVSVVQRLNETSMPFIGATDVNEDLGVRGRGMRVAVVDDGIDYTHANYGGPGTVEAYEENDPAFVEPGTFPTAKVVGGFDFVGDGYDVLDEDTGNDVPRPDDDPIDDGGGHGSHTSGTVAGIGVEDEIGPGAAPRAKLYAYKVWAEGNSTDDVLVAAYERAVDPNQDGDTSDAVDVVSFSGGVDYGTLNSTEARAAQRVVDVGTVFVAAAGNSGNQNVGASAYITGTPANARGVISVAASIDEYNALTLSVNSPPVTLPDGGIMVEQDFGGHVPAEGLTADFHDARAEDPPPNPGDESPADALLCDPVAGNPFAGEVVFTFKGATGEGDCSGSTKVFNAQQAGASAVVLISLFGGFPSALATNGEPITIPAVMVTAEDGYAVLDALSPSPPNYNSAVVNGTLNGETSPIPGFEDSLTDFSSEGPARLTSDMKPDISAPGFDIQSTAAGTGNEGVKLSGTSMAAPHVSGVAALLRQIHPRWSPRQIKAQLMNQATREVRTNDLAGPASATTTGAGRVQALESAEAESLAVPGSLSFGLRQLAEAGTLRQSFLVQNKDNKKHEYVVSGGGPRYADFDEALTGVTVSTNGTSFGAERSFTLKKRKSKRVFVQLALDPAAITEADQLNGWYYFLGNQDGTVQVRQRKNGADRFAVSWHVVPGAASVNSLSADTLDLANGPATMELVEGPAAGASYADLYLLGYEDPETTRSEEDIVAAGARSFTGQSVEDATPEGVPEGTDAQVGLTWLEFLADPDSPTEPIQFGVQLARLHNTTETVQVDVLVDTGADGVFAGTDEGLEGDYLLSKPAAPGGEVCVFDLSLPDALSECAATYFADYSNYNSNLFGLVVDAADIGLTDSDATLSYTVAACTGTFAGDVPGQLCDATEGIDPDTGTYGAVLNAIDPALAIDPLVCKGFWGGPACDAGSPIEVTGDAGTDVLALFPNNAPERFPTIIETTD